jgi:hypothetical protein
MFCHRNSLSEAIRNHFFRSVVITLAAGLLTTPAFAQHLHELYYNNVQWIDTDLTAAAGGPTVQAQGIAAFYTTPNDQFHVYYASNVAGDYHIHQLFYNGSAWSDADLTAMTGGAVASNSSGMTGFSMGNAQYLYFCSPDFNLHEYSYGDAGNFNWVDRNLSALTKSSFQGECGFAPVGLVAFATSDKQRHVYFEAPYRPSARTIHHVFFNGTKWSNQNLTSMTKGAKALGATWMSGFAIGTSQYIFFEGANGHIHEYSYVTSWLDQDLTVASGGIAANTFEGNGALGFRIPGGTKMEVYYAASSINGQDLHRMAFRNSTWTDSNLTSITGAAGPYSLSQMAGFATTPNKQLHVYISGIGTANVDQFYFNGTAWSYEILPSATVAGLGPGMAGFALGNLQHVYYVSAN